MAEYQGTITCPHCQQVRNVVDDQVAQYIYYQFTDDPLEIRCANCKKTFFPHSVISFKKK